MELSPSTVVVRRSGPLTAEVDTELVMLEPDKSLYFGLDTVGRRIWELLEQPQSFEALCSVLQGEFAVDAETCRTDVRGFLSQMAEAELVELR